MYVQQTLCERRVVPENARAGVDEVGRGCLAGPVVAAAVILSAPIPGLADSKTLSAAARERLAEEIKREAVSFGIGLVGQRVIDRINILQATFCAMSMAVAKLDPSPLCLFVDGRCQIPDHILRRYWQKHTDAPLPRQQAIVHGDATIAAISAASILAKTYRDALMQRLAEQWPAYGFERHMGYGTAYHRRVLARLGPCPLHRLSFHGVLPAKVDAPSLYA